MRDAKMKDICSCDVKDKELLASFREKLKHWKTCLSDNKDCHSIYRQLTSLFRDHAIYRTFNEARRLSEETNDPSTGLQGTIIDLLDRNFMDSQAIAIRRLTDQRRDVVSLRSLIDEIKVNISIYTRENYVCYDGFSFDKAPDDDHHVEHSRRARHTSYDYLSGKENGSRSREDKLSSTVLAALEEGIEEDFKITREVRIYVNKWVAHAADPKNREKYAHVPDEVHLHKLDECYQALIRIGKKVELFIDEFLLCSVPKPIFDQLKNWDKPVVTTKDLKALREYWFERDREIENWAKEATIIH
jgi:hypothetical protein